MIFLLSILFENVNYDDMAIRNDALELIYVNFPNFSCKILWNAHKNTCTPQYLHKIIWNSDFSLVESRAITPRLVHLGLYYMFVTFLTFITPIVFTNGVALILDFYHFNNFRCSLKPCLAEFNNLICNLKYWEWKMLSIEIVNNVTQNYIPFQGSITFL